MTIPKMDISYVKSACLNMALSEGHRGGTATEVAQMYLDFVGDDPRWWEQRLACLQRQHLPCTIDDSNRDWRIADATAYFDFIYGNGRNNAPPAEMRGPIKVGDTPWWWNR